MRQLQMEAVQQPAWLSEPAYPYVKLERPTGPEAWPLTFQSLDEGADNGVRLIQLGRRRLVLRRRVAGVPMKLDLALREYEGLAVALLDPEGEGEGVAIVLVHADPSLSVTLYSAPHIDEVVAEWRSWSEDLALPMLVTHADGTRSPAHAMIGELTVADPRGRRPRRGPLKHRRPSVYRRRAVTSRGGLAVYRGEREMIARD